MASELKALVKATGCKPEADEDRQEYLTRLVKAVLDLQEDEWAKLPDADQDWVNEGVLAIKAKKAITDPDEQEEAEEAAPAKKSKPKPVEEEEEAPKPKAKKKPVAEEEEEEAPVKKAKPKKPAKEEEDEDEAPAKVKKPAGTGIVAALREAYITAYLKDPEVSTSKILAALEKKGIVPGKGTINVQLATVKATLKSLKDRGVLSAE